MEPIRPCDIPYTLSRVKRPHLKHPAETVSDPEGRFRALPAGAAYIHEQYGYDDQPGDCFSWNGDWHNWRSLPHELLAQVFSFEELLRLWHDSVIMSKLSDWVDEQHPFLRKIAYAHWHYGFTSNWNLLVDHLNALKSLRCDLPDFEVRITHTRTINTAAWSEHIRDLYLDASFGLLLYYKGEHVLTVGFAPSRHGVLVAQVQLRQKKGNRFLYKLPRHYLDIALGILRDAFGDCLWLVTGESTVAAIRRVYGKEPCKLTADDETRISALYSRPLAEFERDSAVAPHKHEGRVYVRLRAKAAVRAA